MRPSRSITRAGLSPRPACRQRFGEHDLARLGAAVLARRHRPFGLGPPVGRHDPAAAGAALQRRKAGRWMRVVDAQHPAWRLAEAADRASLVASEVDRPQPRQHTLAGRQRRLASPFGRHKNAGRRAVACPIDRPRHGFPVRVGAGDLDHHRFGQSLRSIASPARRAAIRRRPARTIATRGPRPFHFSQPICAARPTMGRLGA